MQETLERPLVRHRFGVADFNRMAEVGILMPEDRVELIEGELVDMAPIGDAHASATDTLIELVAGVAGRSVQVRVQGPLRLNVRTQVQPDLMLLRRRPDKYREGPPGAADVLLLVEVADTSLAYDRGAKLALYARHVVPEVWIVDLVNRAVEICRVPGPQGYADRRRLTTGTERPALVPDLTLDLDALLG